MANQDRQTFLARQSHGLFELPCQSFGTGIVVQKDMTSQVRNIGLPCRLLSRGFHRGTAVNKEQPLIRRHRHQRIHRRPILGQTAAHVIIESLNMRNTGQPLLHDLHQLLVRHLLIHPTRPQFGTAVVAHRQVQHDGMTVLMRFFSVLGSKGRVRQKGQIQWPRQGKHIATASLVIAEIINNHRQTRLLGYRNQRHQRGCQCGKKREPPPLGAMAVRELLHKIGMFILRYQDHF